MESIVQNDCDRIEQGGGNKWSKSEEFLYRTSVIVLNAYRDDVVLTSQASTLLGWLCSHSSSLKHPASVEWLGEGAYARDHSSWQRQHTPRNFPSVLDALPASSISSLASCSPVFRLRTLSPISLSLSLSRQGLVGWQERKIINIKSYILYIMY